MNVFLLTIISYDINNQIINIFCHVLSEMTEDFLKTVEYDCSFAHILAGFLSLANLKSDALDWLEIAVNKGFINYPLLNNLNPFLRNIRGEERFKKLMERVKYEWENFEV